MNGKECILTSKNRVLTCDFSCHFGRSSACSGLRLSPGAFAAGVPPLE